MTYFLNRVCGIKIRSSQTQPDDCRPRRQQHNTGTAHGSSDSAPSQNAPMTTYQPLTSIRNPTFRQVIQAAPSRFVHFCYKTIKSVVCFYAGKFYCNVDNCYRGLLLQGKNPNSARYFGNKAQIQPRCSSARFDAITAGNNDLLCYSQDKTIWRSVPCHR